MYKKHTKKMADTLVKQSSKTTHRKTVFERESLSPNQFIPHDEVSHATFLARDILANRTDEDIQTLASAVLWVKNMGELILAKLARELLKQDDDRQSVLLTEGRELFMLTHYFDIQTLEVTETTWGQLFATLTLMQCAEYTSAANYNVVESDQLSKAIMDSLPHTLAILNDEIIDSAARAECLEAIHSDPNKARELGRKGGKARVQKIEPLKTHVINRYLEEYSNLNNKKAGAIIEAELKEKNASLLDLSSAEDKAFLFANWIGDFKNGKFKLAVHETQFTK
jgi:hypothetical protein